MAELKNFRCHTPNAPLSPHGRPEAPSPPNPLSRRRERGGRSARANFLGTLGDALRSIFLSIGRSPKDLTFLGIGRSPSLRVPPLPSRERGLGGEGAAMLLAGLMLLTALPTAAQEPSSTCALDGFSDAALDAGWQTALLGDATGDASIVDGRLRVSSTGSELYHGDDNGVFVYRQAQGDFRVEVTVDSLPQDVGGQYRKACLMVRGTNGVDAGIGMLDPRLMACLVPHFPTPDVPAFQFDVRFADGGTAVELASTVTELPEPVRFALTRRGSEVTVSYSADGGLTWVEPVGGAGGTVEIELGDVVHAGVIAASYDQSQTLAVDFDDFRVCHPDDGPAAPGREAPICDPDAGLDVIYLLDLSESMTADFADEANGAGGSKLAAALEAVERIQGQLELRQDGTRAALITFSGVEENPAANLADSVQVRAPLTPDLGAVGDAVRALGDADVAPLASTPTALAVRETLDVLVGAADPARQPVLIFVTDGVPNIDDEGRGPDAYTLPEIYGISLKDENQVFLPWGEVAWAGHFNGATDTFDGEPLSDTMRALEDLAAASPVIAYGVAVHGNGVDLGTYKDDLVEYAAHVTGGRSFSASSSQGVLDAADAVLVDLDCGAPGTGTIGDAVWNDLDGDGEQDPSEPGISGVALTVRDNADNVVASASTDLGGGYLIRGLAPGTYTVSVDPASLPTGIDVATFDADGLDSLHQTTVTLEAFAVDRGLDFGYRAGAGGGPDVPQPTDCAVDAFDQNLDDWTITSIGGADQGGAELVDGRLHLTSNGSTLWDDDRFHFAYRTASGDFRVEVDIEDLIAGPAGASFRKGGLMIRGGLDVRSPRIMVQYIPNLPDPPGPAGTMLQFGYRAFDGQRGQSLSFVEAPMDLPTRVAIERRGSTYSAWFSRDDGLTWEQQTQGWQNGVVNLDLGDEVYVGLSVASYDTATPMTLAFDDFAVCKPSAQLPPPPPAPECDGDRPLDMVFALDLSESMANTFAGAADRVEAARDALVHLGGILSNRGDGSRAALVTYRGSESQVLSGLTTDFGALATILGGLDAGDASAATPTGLGLHGAVNLLADGLAPGHRPMIVLLTDGLPNVDLAGQGPYVPEGEALPVTLLDDTGNFLAPGQVAWQGDFVGAFGAFEGEPVAQTMLQAIGLRGLLPELQVFSVALQTAPTPEAPSELSHLLTLLASQTDGGSLSAGSSAEALAAVEALYGVASCGAPLVPDDVPPSILFTAPADGVCLRAEDAHTLTGLYAEPYPSTGEDGTAPPLVIEVVGSDGATQSFTPAIVDGTFTVPNLSLGSRSGTATVLATGTDSSENVSRVGRSWTVDAEVPTVRLLLDGEPFAAAGPGASPPAGAQPVLLGRRVSLTASVIDGPGAPPAATLTLNGAPYVPGTAITADGDYLVVARAVDCAGREAVTHAFLRVDLNPPRLLSTQPVDGASLTADPAAYVGTSDPDLATARVDGREATISVSGGVSTFTLSPFPWQEGANTKTIELVDRAGNRATFERSFTVSTTPLGVDILESGLPISPGQVYGRTVYPTAVATDGEANLTVTLNGQPAVNGAAVSQPGSYTFAAQATDGAGRQAQASVTFEINLADGPQIFITSPVDTSTVSDNPITVTGTVSGGSAPVTVTVNDLPATVNGGSWTATVPISSGDFVHLTAVATDSRDRRDVATISVLHLEGAPTLLIFDPADGAVTNRDAIDVVGSVVISPQNLQDGVVTVSGPAGQAQITIPTEGAFADGSFRAVDVPLQVGENTLVASVTDIHGRTGQASVTVFSDGAPPRISVSANGQVLEDGAIFGQPVDLAITVTDDSGSTDSTVVRLNGGEVASGQGDTQLTVSDDGGYLLGVVAVDLAGNEARLERSFVLDRGGCGLSDLQPKDGVAVTEASVTITGKSGQATAVSVSAAGQGFPAQLADGTFLAADVPLAVGPNTLTVTCTDAAGGGGSVNLEIERLASDGGPVVEIQIPTDGALLGDDATNVEGTSTAPAVTVNGLGANFFQGNFGFADMPLSEGPNILSARAVDSGGRVGTDRVVVRLDTAAPIVSITSPDNQARVGVAGDAPATLDVTGLVDVSKEPNLDRVEVFTSAGSVLASVDPATGLFVALAVPMDDTLDAATGQTVTATAFDTLGHQGTATAEVFLDVGGPAIVLETPDDLTRFGEGSPTEVPVRGQAWGSDGSQIRLNGATLDPATLTWSEPGADGRRHVSFESVLPISEAEGAFGLIAQINQPDDRFAEARRLLFKDSRAPEVVETIPSDGESGVDPNALLLVLFSEPVAPTSLQGPGGLSLIRQSTGQPVVATVTQAGAAVGLAPGATLAAGEAYTLRVGTGIHDAAGNALVAPVDATFTVTEEATAQAPVLDALPSVVCAPEIVVTGTAAPFAQLVVRDGSLEFRGFADDTGAFTVSVPVSANGYHVLRVTASDPNGAAVSPEATLVVQVDCSAPRVRDAVFDRTTAVITVRFTEDVDPATVAVGQDSDGLRLRDAEDPDSPLQSAGLSFTSADVLTLQLDASPTAFWRDRPVRLQVGPPVADGEGNAMAQVFETVFFPGGDDLSGGFLFGEVYDDHSGRPLGSARARLFDAGAGLPGAVAGGPTALVDVTTEGRGRYTMAGSVPAARYAVLLEKGGYSRVVRRLALEPSTGAVPFDARLTPLSEPLGSLDPVAGGRLAGTAAAPAAIEADPAALPGTDPLDARLTALSAQGLPDFLPLGWTPAVAVDLRLEQGGDSLLNGAASGLTAGGVRLDLPLDAWVDGSDTLVAVQYQLGAGIWTVLDDPLVLTGDVIGLPASRRVAQVSPTGPGVVAVVVPDTHPDFAPALPTAAGELLQGAARPADIPAFEADLTLDPPIVTPTGRSRARVVTRSADGATPWPSGLAVQAFLEETLILAAGQGQVLEAPFAADIVLYQPRLSPAEQGANLSGSAGAAEFMVSPSPRAAQVLLDVGYEDVRIYPFPESVERGPVVGPSGGTVGQADGLELIIPEGALSAEIVATAELVPVDEVPAGVAQWTGYTTLAAVRVDFQGRKLGRAATLRLPVPDGAPAEVDGDPRTLLVEIVDAPDDLRAAFPKLTARSRRQGTGSQARIIAGPDSNGGLPLEGLVREGLYLVLHADQPIGYATGTVSEANGLKLDRSRTTVPGLGTADLSREGGRYTMPVPSGDAQTLRATHPETDEIGSAGTTVAAGQSVSVDLVMQATPPTILGLTPANGAVDQPTLVTVAVQWSEPLDPTTISPGSLRVQLADADGNGVGLFANGEAKLSADGSSLFFDLERPLAPGRNWVASFHGGVRDLRGAAYQGAVPITWRFSTSTVVSPGGQVDASKFHVEVPVGGVSRVYAENDALPRAQLGQAPWTVVPYAITRRGLDPVSVNYPASLTGSFEGTLGTPGYEIEISTEVWVKVIDPQGQVAAEFQLGPMASPDGKGFVAPAGEALTFRTADGITVDVPGGAFDEATLVRVEMLSLAEIPFQTPNGLAPGAYINLDFDGEANKTLRLSVPAPAGAELDAQVFVGEGISVSWGRRLQMLTFGAVVDDGGERMMSNAASTQPEPPAGSFLRSEQQGLLKAEPPPGEEDEPTSTCADTEAQGGQCMASQLLAEFTRRSQAVWYYESGADWALIAGQAGGWALGSGAQQEVIANAISDLFVFIPSPRDTKGGFWILPVIGDEPLVIQRRDAATGWVLSEEAYDPVAQSEEPVSIALVDPLQGSKPAPPMLVSAAPFEFLRFSAPPEDTKERLRLEIEAESDTNDRTTLRGVEDFQLPSLTTMQIFDLTPLVPKDEDSEPEGPKEGPKVRLCEDDDSWEIPSFEGTEDMLLVIARGEIDPAEAQAFEFQFDRALKDLSDENVIDVALLEDMGPVAEGCGDSGASGYPRPVPMLLTQEDQGRLLILEPANTLPGGHRFRLRIKPGKLVTTGVDSPRPYWESGPKQFEFSTRKIEGETIGSIGEEGFPFDDVKTARDMLRFGNLLVVGSDTGRMVAINTADVSEEGKFKPYAISGRIAPGIRTFATDGHNRLFYMSLFGGMWAIKTVRVEDIRKGEGTCPDEMPEWAQEAKCFGDQQGAVRVSYMPGIGGLSQSEFLALGGLPAGMPSDLEILSQDEKGKPLGLNAFLEAYKGEELDNLEPDDEGFYTFDLELLSTYRRGNSGQQEPSYKDDPKATPPAVPEFRKETCDAEDQWDRFQRVTVDNLTTGQSWSLDIENVWPKDDEANGDGSGTLEKVRARRGDQLQVRYNLRALGYTAVVGGGISVFDLNRGYKLIHPFTFTQQLHQCGRRLGHYAGTSIEFPDCVDQDVGIQPEGILWTTALVPQSQTGVCEEDEESEEDPPLLPPFLDPGAPADPDAEDEALKCRGKGRLDVYSPLLRVGLVHTLGGGGDEDGAPALPGEEDLSGLTDPGALTLQEMAACITEIDDNFAWLRDVILVNDVEWLDRGIRGQLSGDFQPEKPTEEPKWKRGDLLFASMGMAGIFVFDVSERKLDEAHLVGYLHIDKQSALLLQYDKQRGVVYAGGNDYDDPKRPPIINAWDVRYVNAAPNTEIKPSPSFRVEAPWSTGHLAVDPTGMGLMYTWSTQDGPVAIPVARPKFSFSGLYLPEEEDLPPADERQDDDILPSIQKITSLFVPLGVPRVVKLEEEEQERKKQRDELENEYTAAFKVRLALPGSFGETLTAKVESLRTLPDERYLAKEDLGAALQPPGGPGWPDAYTTVTLRRLGVGEDEEGEPDLVNGEGGQFSDVYNLYESVETVVLIADPRARKDYKLQDLPDQHGEPLTLTADEKAQCRNCDWPQFLPNPKGDTPLSDEQNEGLAELLAGRYVRAVLFVDPDSDDAVQQKTQDALDFFEGQGDNYPAPAGYINVAAAAAPVPSPIQASLAEPPQNSAMWSPGEAGVSVALTGGDMLLSAADHVVGGRGVPFTFDRVYRSHLLGYGPLGSAGWSANLFAHLREITTTGEVEYHDGKGHVWRFYPNADEDAPVPDEDLWDEDQVASYNPPAGVYLRLQKLSDGSGWRLIGRQHDTARFDAQGRLVSISDRHRQGAPAEEQGNTLHLRYDAFGQLIGVTDDLARTYSFEYYDDPKPEDEDGDGDRYGLLKKITDFADRELEYEFDEERRLTKVKYPEVKNPVSEYAQFSYEGEQDRPFLEYTYDPQQGGVVTSDDDTTAILHGEYAELRLSEVFLPDFLESGLRVPRVRFEYKRETGRIDKIGFPTPQNANTSADSVEWLLEITGQEAGNAAPLERVTVRAPWDHQVDYTLEDGRTTEVHQLLEVAQPDGQLIPDVPVRTTFHYEDDGRLTKIEYPDGGERVNCYQDSNSVESQGCPFEGGSEDQEIDHLAKANVVKALMRATDDDSKGTADYELIETAAEYQQDNLVSRVTDGLSRGIQLAVPAVDEQEEMKFETENVVSTFDFDSFGRVKEFQGGTIEPIQVQKTFHGDFQENKDAGLLKRLSRGAEEIWTELDYDDQFNVDEVETSQGIRSETTYDTWDRPVRVVAGLSDGRYKPVGTTECSLEDGARREMAFDAVGHLIRQRSLQDHIDSTGAVQCRWIETRYRYNAREQIVDIERTHLSDPGQPGQVIASATKVSEAEYDEHGRIFKQRVLNQLDPALEMVYRYDEAGRGVGVKIGDAGEQVRGYDVKNRVAYQGDGDQGLWLGRYDAWDRLYHQAQPTGAFELAYFDESSRLTKQESYDADPLADSGDPKLLALQRSHFNSFGAVERAATTLIDEDDQKQVLVTEQEFDDAGRLKAIWSGPPKSNDAECQDVSVSCLETSLARREKELLYETGTGRLLEERFGGDYQADHLHATKYEYHPDNASTLPDTKRYFESVPDGEQGLIETKSSRYERDAFGRVIVERRSDGSVTYTTYDRASNQPIRVRTGADAESRISYDGVGKQIQVFRPSGRGNTLYAYDFDGRLLRQKTTTAEPGDPWVTTFTYDRTGRTERVDYHDGTSESSTYNPDSTVDTFTTRDGILITHTYDEGNRKLSSVPSLEGAELPAGLVDLDAGDFADWDVLSRPTSIRRGADGRADEDPSLTVAYPTYDLASRPDEELVGAREAMGWTYDLYSRPTELTLPSGLSRDPNGSFQGFTRQFDTLDRLYDISGVGALTQATVGVTWHWGGAGRLYGLDTKAALGTAARWGYIEGAGPQGQGDQPPSSKWKLGTLTWGAGAENGMPTDVPENVWGQFAFGWRGVDGDPRDGAKVGRQVKTGEDAGGIDLFAGMGWAWQYDAGVRLTEAYPGRGNLTGDRPHNVDGFTYGYGEGDELDRLVNQAAGTLGNVETGAYGRILSRDGVSFDYDAVGRRTEDDRHVYVWNWRSELIEVTVKDTWPDDQVSPYAGHQVRYAYDAKGRLTHRIHWGPIPEGGGERPFIERRDYVWEHQGLVSEVGFGDPDGTTKRWRKTHVPGLSTLDDAPQVMVENLAFGGEALYTYLRDEMGTVIGIVAEEESSDPASPVIPARYLYTPYGEANVEAGPEVRRSRFDAGVTTVSGVEQATGAEQKDGALRVSFSSALDPASLNGNVIVERLGFGGWQSVPPTEILTGLAGAEPSDLLVMLQSGWEFSTNYRVRLTTDLVDSAGRKLDQARELEWSIPGAFEAGIAYDQRFPAGFDNAIAASNTLGGRFPGGQTSLFHGLWTDPVTGLNYARARWYDARNASWMSEDPLGDVDSPNLYAFVSWMPNMATDPEGDKCLWMGEPGEKCTDMLPEFGNGYWRRRRVDLIKQVHDLSIPYNQRLWASAKVNSQIPLWLLEELGRGIMNVPYNVAWNSESAGEDFANAQFAEGDEKIKLYSQGIGKVCFAFVEGAGAAEGALGLGNAVKHGTKRVLRPRPQQLAKDQVIEMDGVLVRLSDEAVPENEMTRLVGEVEYRSTDLSEFAARIRSEIGADSQSNIAVLEYIDEAGERKLMGAVSSPPPINLHSEQHLIDEAIRQRIGPAHVTRVYTEFEPCQLNFAQCKKLLQEFYPDAKVTYSWEYGDVASRARGRVQKEADIEKNFSPAPEGD